MRYRLATAIGLAPLGVAPVMAAPPIAILQQGAKAIEAANEQILDLANNGKAAQAETLARATLQLAEKSLGDTHELTEWTRTNLAFSLFQQGKYADALVPLEGLLAAREKRLGKDHPETIKAADDLAGVANRAGDSARSEMLYRRVFAAREKEYGKNSAPALEAQGKLAVALSDQNKLQEAEATYAAVLPAMQKLAGKDDPATLKIAYGLALVIANSGRHEEAAKMLEDVLEARAKVLGEEHPETWVTMASLGVELNAMGQRDDGIILITAARDGLVAAQGANSPLAMQVGSFLDDLTKPAQTAATPAQPGQAEMDEAEQLAIQLGQSGNWPAAMEQVDRLIALRRQHLGPDAPQVYGAINMKADMLRRQRRYADADPFVREARDAMIRLFGPDNGNSVSMTTNLAVNLDAMGRHAEAEPFFRQAIAGWEKLYGRKTPDILPPLNGLAFNLMYQGRFDEAEPFLREELALRTELNGADNPDTIFSIVNLGRLYEDQGRYTEAEPYFSEALGKFLAIYGEGEPDTLNTMDRLAVNLKNQNRLPESEALHRRILKARTEYFGETAPSRLQSLNNLGRTLEAQQRFAEAEPLYREALAIATETMGEDDPETLIFAGNLGAVLMYQQRFAEAEPVIRRTLEARTKVLGPNHPQRLYSLNDMALVLFFQDRYSESAPYYQELVPLYEASLGKDHPFTAQAVNNYAVALLSRPESAEEAYFLAEKAVFAKRDRRNAIGQDAKGVAAFARRNDTDAFYFELLMDAAWQLGEKAPDRRPELFITAILAAQEAMESPANRAVTEMAARNAAGAVNADLPALVRDRQQAAEQWQALATTRTAVLTAGGADMAAQLAIVDAQQAEIDTKLAAIDARLGKEFPEYFALVRPQPMNAAEVVGLMKPDEALLLIIPSEFGTHVISVSQNGVSWNRSQLKRREINLLVKRLLWDVGANVNASTAEEAEWGNEGSGTYPYDRRTAYALYRELIEPVEAELTGKRHVFVAAAGALSSLPFGMLLTEPPAEGTEDGDPDALRSSKWLADAYALVQIPSLQSLQFLRRFGKMPDVTTDGFIGFGDPLLGGAAEERGGRGVKDRGRTRGLPASAVFRTADSGDDKVDTAELMKMARLPGTAVELEAMRAALSAPMDSVHVGAGATEASFRSTDLSKASILALATHGLTAGEIRGAAEPGLVFTPPATPGVKDDGYLTASEVASLKLNADWVILSACNSAAGDGSEGAPGLSGLARAFFYAGARNLLASHWPVRDDVASLLTVRTIEIQRGNPNLSRAEALQRAMKEIRNSKSHDSDFDTWAHPNAWAPFTLIGDAGE